ncbi:MAG: hypothetical protein RIS35_133 [Pseudomonadota bacterium]|jgi:hypothetical protein
MSWLSATWVMIATAIGMVGLVHGFAWMRWRSARANGAFMMLACSLALAVLLELQMLRAETPEAFGDAVWYYHFALWGATVGCVLYLFHYLHAGRRWLGWLAIGLRSLVALINAFSSPNINFTQIASIERVNVFGEQVSIGHGDPNAWMLLGLMAFLMLALFVADAACSLWRAGDRLRGWFVGGLVAIFVIGEVA